MGPFHDSIKGYLLKDNVNGGLQNTAIINTGACRGVPDHVFEGQISGNGHD